VSRVSRRTFLRGTALGLAGAAAGGFGAPGGQVSLGQAPALRRSGGIDKVIVLGMDGMDPHLLRRFIAEGELPTFKRLIEQAHCGELQTTMPPHSPVAWSSFITGTNPGGHAIYDFVHREPTAFEPYMSTSRSFDAGRKLSLGGWDIPLGSGRVELMRKGRALWSVLEDNNVDASLYAIPANFPVVPGAARTVSGMGTPDLLGTYGTFTYFTDAEVPRKDTFVGGRVVPLPLVDHLARVTLEGPKHPFRPDQELGIEITFQRDPWEKLVRIELQGRELLMAEGEWSEWMPLRFEVLPLMSSIAGMVRLYVKEVHPHLKVYCSPINIDPLEPTLPICTPNGYSRELTAAVGRFYTQGFPADSKALSQGVLSNDEYLAQSRSVLAESRRLFSYQLGRFQEGFFFFYFSSIDQNCHMLWRNMDPTHPLYDPAASPEVKNGIRWFYRQMDDVLKETLGRVDERTLLMVMSDHGFAPFTREVNISTWLVEQGYTVLTDPSKLGEGEFYQYVDWSKTSAYALGLNGIYINRAGREKQGWVTPEEAEKIRLKIIAELTPLRDPRNNARVITNVYKPEEIYSGPFVSLAPDLVVGYQRGYRISDEAVLGKFPKSVIADRTDLWAADHCLDPAVVPGVLIMNRPVTAATPGLWDLAPTILSVFGIAPDPGMTGQVII